MDARVQCPKSEDFGGPHREQRYFRGEMCLIPIQNKGCLFDHVCSITRREKVGTGVGGLALL